MAPRHSRRNHALVVVYDAKEEGYLVFRFNVQGLFSDRPDHTPELRPFPCPIARFPTLRRTEDMAFAASPGGTKILAVTNDSRTFIYDTAKSESCCPGPDLRTGTFDPVVLAAGGGREMFVSGNYPFESRGPHCEALRLHAGRWRARPLPQLPFAYDHRCHVGGYFAVGTRIWVSMFMAGTYSLDMARGGGGGAWRKEGGWELPFYGRAAHAADLGLLLGLSSGNLCACDARARPPVVLREWSHGELLPEEDEFYHYPVLLNYVGMAYLGGGGLCISWSSTPAPAWHPFKGRLLALTAVEVTRCGGSGELQLRKHKSRCYHMTPGQVIGRALSSL